MSRTLTTTVAALVAAGVLAWSGAPAQAQSGSRTYPPARSGNHAATRARLALEGYAPVSGHDEKRWVKGGPSYGVVYDGHTYFLTGDLEKRSFQADPEKYAPALNGDCVVYYSKMGRRVPGNIRHALFDKGRLFLFASADAKQAFAASPATYENADQAFGGLCAVCRAMGRRVPGKPELAVRYAGLRYLFPAAKQREMFLANPEKYKVGAAPAAQPGGGRPPMGSGGR